MFLNINQFLLKHQLSCASRTICISILSQTSSQGFKLSIATWTEGHSCRVYLICSAMRVLVFFAHVLRERGVSTGLWLLGFWYSAKLERKKTKLVVFPSLCITLVKTQRRPFKLQAQLSPLSIQHEFLFVIYRLAMAWMLAAQFPRSCTVSSIHLCQEKQSICCILHCQPEGTGAQHSSSFILLRGGCYSLFFFLREG